MTTITVAGLPIILVLLAALVLWILAGLHLASQREEEKAKKMRASIDETTKRMEHLVSENTRDTSSTKKGEEKTDTATPTSHGMAWGRPPREGGNGIKTF